MSTIVYQGLDSCLESQLVESRTLRLKLSSPKLHFSQSLESALKSSSLDSNTNKLEEKCHFEEINNKTSSLDDEKNSSNPDLGGWSFLQALSNSSQALSNSSQAPKEEMKKENIYVHPLVKRSLSTLSDKGLEMCTENLGSETGTEMIEDSIFSMSSSDSKGGDSPTREQHKSRQLLGARKASLRSSPPPLTTIRGPESLQVRPHREDGRLIIKAVMTTPVQTYFQAERTHGRLRLWLLKNCTSDFDSQEPATEKNEKEEVENDTNAEEDVEDFEDFEEEQESDSYLGEDMEGNGLNVGGEMGMEKFQRPSRCKEGESENKGLLNWEPLWVATS